MKKNILSFASCLTVFIAFHLSHPGTAGAQTEIPTGNVIGLWDRAKSPYRINGEITVPNGETLAIEPGVEVVFTGHYKFNIQGRLLAVGTETDTIAFTALDPQGGWHGMRFINTPGTNDSSKIVYCSLKYGKANTGDDLDRCGGAMAIKNFNKVLISNCLIAYNSTSGNMSTTGGGGIALWTASPTITGCEFYANTGVYGPAMVIYYSSNALIGNNHFHGHTGHGLINIGAGSAPILMNNLIENNTSTAPAHGVIHFEGGSGRAVLINNTIVNNDCGGGAIWESDGSTPLFVNDIIYGNTPAQVRLEVPSALHFFNCLIEGGREGFTGTAFSGTYQNCLDSNPAFADSNDFHLQDASPCISSGVDSIQMSKKRYTAPAYDFDGNPRPNPVGSRPDIGAFESVLGNPAMGVHEAPGASPNGFQLHPNYPNPFNPATSVSYELPSACDVRLTVGDVMGREVAVLEQGRKAAGAHRIEFDGTRLAGGVYFCRLQAGSEVMTRKMVLLK
jgi:hypothetical protein